MESQVNLCKYPFVFDAQAKTTLLQTDAVIQMQVSPVGLCQSCELMSMMLLRYCLQWVVCSTVKVAAKNSLLYSHWYKSLEKKCWSKTRESHTKKRSRKPRTIIWINCELLALFGAPCNRQPMAATPPACLSACVIKCMFILFTTMTHQLLHCFCLYTAWHL